MLDARKNTVAVMKTVASRLGNTPAICRKCYVHPALVDAYVAGSLTAKAARRRAGLNRDEAAFVEFLRRRNRAARELRCKPVLELLSAAQAPNHPPMHTAA